MKQRVKYRLGLSRARAHSSRCDELSYIIAFTKLEGVTAVPKVWLAGFWAEPGIELGKSGKLRAALPQTPLLCRRGHPVYMYVMDLRERSVVVCTNCKMNLHNLF
ncbi:hypothetical protein ACJJTC_017243 [Scirpophaga incertulas]